MRNLRNCEHRELPFSFHPNYIDGGDKMGNKNPIEYTGKVLDQRNTLTGPDDAGKASYPKRPEHVPIQQSNKREE